MSDNDWLAAEAALTSAARSQFAKFLAGSVAPRVYAVGFFFDADSGDVYPVANTMDHHSREFRSRVKDVGDADEQTFLWDSGQWEFPVGLFPSDSAEFLKFDEAWAAHREAIAGDTDATRGKRLELICIASLRQLAGEKVFAPAVNLMGYMVQCPDDPEESLVMKHDWVTEAVTR